ncbi:unnamed protein product, partial [Arabidopsis halleri]
VISRTKRVTDPLDDEAKARIFSSHGCILDQDSPRLYELVHGYFEDGHEETLYDSDSDLSENSVVERPCEDSEEILKMAASFSDSDPYRNLLLAHVLRAVEVYSGFRSRNKSVFRDKVASFLRELGHNAAVCVSKWNSSAKLTAGSYDFIDVVDKSTSDNDRTAVRYFVDLDFASQFEIARPMPEYMRVLQLLPNVFVGKEENLRTIVRESCDAAKRSLKSRGLSLPPWRRSSYLQHKWFGPYKRKVGSSLGAKSLNSDAVSCRSLGFDDGAAITSFFIRA